ncbi:YqkE family protein [Sutcliffiella rhizosphaerae]|uniref:DUF3886 domain-containing protein n=1 Tax=Sutcliffiella rhizosphaerae TaxID=2880967 RepID=A0ABM8YR42_9BACI|nr:YqkE family protein [Sutcliffiella rhizosphaerae]CAG9622377.1 hypothetical protein BACCIP111883_03168 [Sutcliffiella rhizosphaerae]
MKKNKKNIKCEDKLTLKDQLEGEVFSKLKSMKNQLVEAEQKIKEDAAIKAREEKRMKEKNKSFAELFEESNQNWRNFK